MVSVVDDIVTKQISDKIQEMVFGLNYFYKPKTTMTKEIDAFGHSYYDSNIDDNGQFCRVLMLDGEILHNYQEEVNLLQPLIEAAKNNINGAKIIGIDRIKVNLILKQPNLSENHYNIPHKDFPDFLEPRHHSMVYYCEDSDGDTVLFDQFHNPLEIPKVLTINQRISPKKNRAVIFESNRWHSSSNPRYSKTRCVINFVFMTKPV
jgi:hypothetical protein